MNLDPRRPAARGRTSAASSLALFAGTLAVAATALAADPPTVCHDRPSGPEWNDTEKGDFTLQNSLGDGLLLCARASGPVRFDERKGTILELPRGSSVAVETRGRKGSQRMRVTADKGGPRYEWWLDGAPRTPDDAARAWLAEALEVVAAYRAIGEIQGQVGGLQGQIGAVQGRVGALQGEIGGIQGRIGSLQGEVGRIQGERGRVQGQIGAHQGAIGGLEARRAQASAAERARIDDEIAAHRAAIRKLETDGEGRELDRRTAEARAELLLEEEKARGEIAALQRRIEEVHAAERIGRLERQIADLHADEHIAEIEGRMKPAVGRLRASIQRFGG